MELYTCMYMYMYVDCRIPYQNTSTHTHTHCNDTTSIIRYDLLCCWHNVLHVQPKLLFIYIVVATVQQKTYEAADDEDIKAMKRNERKSKMNRMKMAHNEVNKRDDL